MDKNLSTAEIFKKLKSDYEKRSVDNSKNRTSSSRIQEHSGCPDRQSAQKYEDSTRKQISGRMPQKSLLEHSSTKSPIREELSKDQTWVKKPDQADFKITSQTESLLQVLPNKVQGLDFIGPKYSLPSKTTEIVNEPDADSSEEEVSSDKEIAPQFKFIDRDQILCDRTEFKNPFRVIYGNISVQASILDSKLNGLINKIKSSRNIPELSLTQMWAMLKVFEGENVIFVETPSLNYITTYFLPMIAKTFKNDKLYGPSNIILAADVQMVAKIERILKYLSEEKLCLMSYYGDDVDLKLEEKFALCDFVISTPKNVSKLLVTIKPTELSKLNCVAFDSIHRMNDFLHEEIFELIKALQKLTRGHEMSKNLNFVMTTEFWTQQLENITQATLINPILFLACPLQAAICSNIQLSLKVFENNTQKLKKCTAILKKINFSKRIILCSNVKEMAAVESYLKTCSINYVVMQDSSDRKVLFENIRKDKVTILCSEAMLSGLEIDDADCLILFSLFPSLKDSFSVFQSHLTKESCQKCASYIFIDEKSDFKLTNMISNLNVEKPENLEQILKNAKEAYETSKLDVPFCEKLIQFGKCSMELLCPKRHILDAYRDSDKTRLSKKRVILEVVNVYDATHYYGKVSCQFNGDRVTESDMNVFSEYRENFRCLSHFLSKLQGRPKIGDQVIVPSDVTDVMERGEIVNILRRDKNLVPITVSVFVESGHIIHRDVDEVYELPQKFKNLPVESVNIILGGIVPSDSSGIWSPNVTAIARNSLINKKLDRKTLFTGNIQMMIGNTIVLDDIICYEIRNDLELAQKFSMSQQLLTSKYAEQDKIVIKNLIDSCIKAGLKIGLDSSPIVQSSEENEIKKSLKRENLQDTPSKTEALKWYLDDAPHTQTDAVSSSNVENEETENVQAPTVSSNFQNEETENVQDLTEEKEEATPSGTPSEDDSLDISSDFHFGKCEEDDNKNMDLESLFMKMCCETLNEFKGNDEWEQFPLKADESSASSNSDDDKTVKNESEVSASEKDSNPSTGKTKVQIQQDQSYLDECDRMADKNEIHEEFKMQQNRTVDGESEFQFEATQNNEKTENEFEIEVSQTSQNEKTLKTNIDGEVHFEKYQDTESEYNPREEQRSKNESSKSEIQDKAKSFKAMPAKESAEKSQNMIDGKNEVQIKPTVQVDSEDLTHDEGVEVNEIVADESEDNQSTDEPSVPYFSPKVYWRQKDDLIWARIMILDVKDYKIKYAKNFFTFRADLNENVYFLTILTFAPTVPESFTCNVTGQYVEVRFEAAFKGFDWPRLTYLDDGGSRIKRDPDDFEHEDTLPICDQILLLGVTDESSPPKQASPSVLLDKLDLNVKENKGKDLSAAIRALHTSQPCELPGRENKIEEISDILKNCIETHESTTLYISGQPGTGKTACLNYILNRPEDFHFGKCEEDDNKNMDLESLFMKMCCETLNEFKGNDEWEQFPLKADESSASSNSDDDKTVKNESEVSASEKDSNPSTGKTKVQIQQDQSYLDECDRMADKNEIHEEFKMQQNRTVDGESEFQFEATQNNEKTENEFEIEVSQTSQNEKTLKTNIDGEVHFEKYQDTESEYNPREEQRSKNESSKSEIQDKAKSFKAMPAKESAEKSQNMIDGKNEVQIKPTVQVDSEDLTHDEGVEVNEIVADESEDNQSTDEPSVPYFSPKVYWRQKDDLIWARIMILDVKDYKIKYAKNFFTFRADLNENVYFLTILTFAPTVPESFTCNVTGQYVEVRFEAAFKGFDWPRLTYLDDGGSRIKRDPDDFEHEDTLPICDQILLLGEQRLKLKEEFGTIKKPEDEFRYVPEAVGAPPDCDLDSESDDSDSNFIDQFIL